MTIVLKFDTYSAVDYGVRNLQKFVQEWNLRWRLACYYVPSMLEGKWNSGGFVQEGRRRGKGYGL